MNNSDDSKKGMDARSNDTADSANRNANLSISDPVMTIGRDAMNLADFPLTRIILLALALGGSRGGLGFFSGRVAVSAGGEANGPLSPSVRGTLKRVDRDGRGGYEVSRSARPERRFTAWATAR